MQIKIDESRCVGGGQCVSAADDVFDQRDEDGVVVVVSESLTVAPEAEARVKRAASLCPAQAIRLVE